MASAMALQIEPSEVRNRILAALPVEEAHAFLKRLEAVSLVRHRVVYEPDEPIRHVYFLESGLAFFLTTTPSAVSEVGIVGREGMVGLPVVLGTETSPHRAFVLAGGHAYRMRAEDLREAMEASASLRNILLRYVHAFMVQTAQSAACNGTHTIQERIARWLLTAHERLGRADLPLTHELLGLMLAVRRASVSLAIHAMRDAGVIEAKRGVISILDETELSRMTCECYHVIKREFDRLPEHASRPVGTMIHKPHQVQR